MAVVKDSTYHNTKLQNSIKSRIASIIFRLWDPLTAWVEGCARRCAEISADIVQTENDFYIDSAQGARLDRRLGTNENVPRLLAQPANDGTVTLARQTAPSSSTTFQIGDIVVAPIPDPSQPTSNRPTYSNTVALTINPGQTSWTVPMVASRGGSDTNMPIGQELQMVTQATLLDTAVVATAFTTGTDDETDSAYRQRGKLVIRSRTLATDDALVAAALTAGAAFAYTVESFAGGGTPPVTLYCCAADGTLSTTLQNNVKTYINGDSTANPPIPMARAKGIWVDVQPATTVTFNFSIGLVLQIWVTGTTLTQLQTDLQTAITAYVQGLNSAGNTDRTMRINRIKDICMTFRGRGVMDVTDATFLPAASTALTAQQMAVMGTITWL